MVAGAARASAFTLVRATALGTATAAAVACAICALAGGVGVVRAMGAAFGVTAAKASSADFCLCFEAGSSLPASFIWRIIEMAIELIDVLKRIAAVRGITLEHEVARHNVEITEFHAQYGRKPPAATKEEWAAREKERRKQAVDKAREKRQAACELS